MQRKASKRYTDTFKKQIVELIRIGRKVSDIANEYNIAKSTVRKWVNNYSSSGSFKSKDNKSDLEIENKQLRKNLAYAEMELDILKQAALIMARKKR